MKDSGEGVKTSNGDDIGELKPRRRILLDERESMYLLELVESLAWGLRANFNSADPDSR